MACHELSRCSFNEADPIASGFWEAIQDRGPPLVRSTTFMTEPRPCRSRLVQMHRRRGGPPARERRLCSLFPARSSNCPIDAPMAVSVGAATGRWINDRWGAIVKRPIAGDGAFVAGTGALPVCTATRSIAIEARSIPSSAPDRCMPTGHAVDPRLHRPNDRPTSGREAASWVKPSLRRITSPLTGLTCYPTVGHGYTAVTTVGADASDRSSLARASVAACQRAMQLLILSTRSLHANGPCSRSPSTPTERSADERS